MVLVETGDRPVILDSRAPDIQTDAPRDIIRRMAHQRFRLPRNLRDLFEYIAYYNSGRGLDDLLDLIDFSATTSIDICRLVHGRAPTNDECLHDHYDPRHHFQTALLGDEFRRNAVRLFLTAFSEKGRDVFIHIPKCAGTDLIFNLTRQLLPLPTVLQVKDWVPDADFIAALAGIARAAHFHDRIFVYGHIELSDYINDCGIRPIDRVFTIIRDPIDLMISQANYAIGRLRQDPTGRDPDTAELLGYLGIRRLPDEPNDRDLKDLAVKALFDARIAPPNQACRHLGYSIDEAEPSYETAMTNLIGHDIEVTTTQLYGRWLDKRWGISRSERHNQSDPILTRQQVLRYYSQTLKASVAEDQKLFDLVSRSLQMTGAPSITGTRIAKITRTNSLQKHGIGSRIDVPLPANTKLDEIIDIAVAQKPKYVIRYLAPPMSTIPGTAKCEVLLDVDFGIEGSGKQFQLSGWSSTEKHFTWSEAAESSLKLPALPGEGTCVLQLIGHPFVWEDRLPNQRLEVVFNGQLIGTCRLRDLAVIEVDLPSRLFQMYEPNIVILRLPDAARASDIKETKDDRILAFGLHRMIILQFFDGSTTVPD